MRSPGDTVDVDFSLEPTIVPSFETRVLVEAEADCFKELGVMVDVEDDLDLSVVRWLSLSSKYTNRLAERFFPPKNYMHPEEKQEGKIRIHTLQGLLQFPRHG